MVRVEDVSRESVKLSCMLDLARKIFDRAYSVSFERNAYPPSSIEVMAVHGRRISFINLAEGNLTLFDEDYLEKAESFAKEYEKKFSPEKDFVVKTDYSGLFSQRS